jgi:hypothetical protein
MISGLIALLVALSAAPVLVPLAPAAGALAVPAGLVFFAGASRSPAPEMRMAAPMEAAVPVEARPMQAVPVEVAAPPPSEVE